MVYHRDCNHSLHMAISYDSYNWTSLNNGEPVICGDTIAMQHGIRDPHIFRGPDGGFYLAMTDLHIFGSKEAAEREGHFGAKIYRDTEWDRDGKLYGWGNNRGLVMMKSFDLINWTRTNLDFTKLTCPSIFTDKEGNTIPWSEVSCVWAPETVYDEEAGHLMTHFTIRARGGQAYICYVYMNDDFTEMISDPKPIDFGDGGIDSDIIKVGDTYHFFYAGHGTVNHATSSNITGPYVRDTTYNDGETPNHEAPTCWKRIGKDEWVIMFDNFCHFPHDFGFVETTDFENYKWLGYFGDEDSPMKRSNFEAQKHGAVTHITLEEAHALEEYWK